MVSLNNYLGLSIQNVIAFREDYDGLPSTTNSIMLQCYSALTSLAGCSYVEVGVVCMK